MTALPLDEFLHEVDLRHGEETWVILFKMMRAGDGSLDGSFYSALVAQTYTQTAMGRAGWDVMLGAGAPGFSTHWNNGEQITEYHRHDSDNFLRLALYREFHGRKENYFEILEEFRLLHNLYFDPATGGHYGYDEAGDEVLVLSVSRDEVRVRRSYLRAFMAAVQMDLLLYFERTEHFLATAAVSDSHRSSSITWDRYSGESYSNGYNTFVRALGKKLLPCEPVERCGIWPFERTKNYEEFLIGGDVDSPIRSICDPDKLSNYFGANPGSPHYLTPVFFKKEVMQKYYRSSEFEVSDGHLDRRGAWGLRFDNNSPTHVSVFLGDLGRDLPESEQVYWKAYNVFPDGRKISRTNYERSFLGNFYDPENPEHMFKHAFTELQTAWEGAFGWPLFLPLSQKDMHYLASVRSMLSSEQSEFDEQILGLAKVTIESANVKGMRAHLQLSDDDSKSIVLLRKLFTHIGLEAEESVGLLQRVQSVRSTGAAHRKGEEYEKAMSKLGIDGDYQTKFDVILRGFATLFDSVREAILPKDQ